MIEYKKEIIKYHHHHTFTRDYQSARARNFDAPKKTPDGRDRAMTTTIGFPPIDEGKIVRAFCVLFFFFFFVFVVVVAEETSPRKQKSFLGVDPIHAHKYEGGSSSSPNPVFVCGGGGGVDDDGGASIGASISSTSKDFTQNVVVVGKKQTVDFTKINDNFCDCEDGSDEPGTNACSHVKDAHGFYCQNVGSEPKLIKNSFVNDNVCDCCDGSDERFNAKKHCQNTCYRDGKETMESLRKEVRDLESGIQKKRNEYAKTMEKAKSDGEKEVVRLEKSVKQLSAEKQKKQAEEEKANELFQEKEKLKEERDEEKERKRREEEERQNPSSTPHPNDESKEEREMREMEEEMREIEREGEVDRAGAKIAASESKRREEVKNEENDREETDEERGRRIAEQWVHSDDDDDRRREGRMEEEEGGENEEGFIDGDYADPDGHDDHSYDDDDDDDDVDYEDDYYPSNGDDEETDEEVEAEATTKKVGMLGRMKRMLVGDKKSKRKTQRTSEENDKIEDEERALEDARKLRDEASRKASQARDKFEESNNKLSTLKAKIEKLSSVTSDETTKLLVGALFNQCFSTQADKYTYEICLFGQSKQDSHVRLGDMKNDMKNEVVFEDASGKRFVKFENGEKCWNGPKRSMTVELVCGSKEALFDVLEPSRCEYSSKFSTPIACDEKQLEMKKLELERLVARERNAKGERGEEEVEYVVNY